MNTVFDSISMARPGEWVVDRGTVSGTIATYGPYSSFDEALLKSSRILDHKIIPEKNLTPTFQLIQGEKGE